MGKLWQVLIGNNDGSSRLEPIIPMEFKPKPETPYEIARRYTANATQKDKDHE